MSCLPAETGGGILADDMGLGKTLAVISTIIRTANEAKSFAEKQNNTLHQSRGHNESSKYVASRSTLVLCPSPCKFHSYAIQYQPLQS
jgi:SWI/SNF-related matrix-associated actin-dependent regulator of chromatin subfamily A3